MEKSDELLMTAYRQGNDDAFGELLSRHADSLLSFLIRMTGNREQAEDLFQETFMRVHDKAWSFNENRKFKTWLFTIASRIAIDERRKSVRRPITVTLNGIKELPSNPGRSTDPSRETAAQETKEQVQRAINILPEQQRLVVLLSHYHGLTYTEIADTIKCSLSTVKTHMSRALRSLAKHLPDLKGEHACI